MDGMELQQYLLLFLESIGSTTAWQFSSDIRYFGMLYFGSYAIPVALLAAVTGATIGAAINLFAGYIFSNVQLSGRSAISPEHYEKWRQRCILAAPFIGMLGFVHLIGALVFAAGFLRVPPTRIVPFLLMGQALYYGYYVLSA